MIDCPLRLAAKGAFFGFGAVPPKVEFVDDDCFTPTAWRS